MGRLIDGNWSNHDLGPDERGRFVRRAAKFRNRISADGSSGFPAEPGRYHLYVSHACGWSHRALLLRSLKGLHDVVPISTVEPFMGEHGWTFAAGGDPLLGKRRLYEIYLAAQHDYTGRASVPVLWDRKTATIVSNESLDIIAAFDGAFAAHTDVQTRFLPDERRDAIEAMIQANYGPVNNAVYRAGFAGNQEAHEEAVRELFARLDELESLLAGQRYLMGDTLSAADLCLFPTLFRFDAVYHMHFKCNIRRLADFTNLWAYTRDVYQYPGVAETCDLTVAKQHYYTSHESINPRRFVPLGPTIDFEQPHGREHLEATS